MNPVIQELHKIRIYDKKISIIQSEIERLEAGATNVVPQYGGEVVSGSHVQDKIGNSAAEIADLKTEIARLEQKRNDYRKILFRIPEIISNSEIAEKQIEVLYKRYFEYKNFYEITVEMNCSERQIFRIHGRALQSYGTLMKEDAKDG